jgi:putative MATE family efflux protein
MKDLTEGKESKLIFNFALPMLLGNLFQQLYNIVDSVIVGNFVGKEALAAVGASFPIIFTLISFVIGIASGGTIIIAQYFGAKDINKVRNTIGTMYIFIFIASIIVTTLGITFSEEIFRLIQLPEEVLPEASTYLNIYLIGMVAFFGFNATSAILRGIGDSRTPLYFLIVSTILNISFDLLFIVVMDFGIAGAAWATVLSQSIAFISAIVYLNRHHEVINIKVREMRFYKDIFKQALRIGLPTGMQHTFVSLGITFIMSIVNKFGTDVIAAYTVATRIDSLALLPAMNIGQALATFVGQNIGAQKTERVKSGLKATFAISSVISLFVTGIVVIFGDVFMRFFTDDPNVIEIGEKYLVIVSSFYLLFSAMFTVNGVLRGAGDTLIPMFITLFSLWLIRIPVAYFLSDRIGETGIWWAVPIAWSAGTIVSYFYYLSGKWKTKSVVKQKEHPKADS